jgi:hypothetical protein
VQPLNSTTAAKEGQALLEFLIVLPFFFSLTWVLLRINGLIQISINNQQYTIGHTFFLTFNHPHFPQLDYKEELIKKSRNAMILGVSENVSPGQQSYAPEAPSWLIVPKQWSTKASDASGTEPDQRARVRVRNTVSLCSETDFLGNGARSTQMLEASSISTMCGGLP